MVGAVFPNHRATSGYETTDLVRLAMLAMTAAGPPRHRTAAATMLESMPSPAERRHHATAASGCRRRSTRSTSVSCCSMPTPAREFINRAFRDHFRLSDEKADSQPPFIALMYHGRDTGAFELPEEELSAFIARRTEMMRSGDSRRSTSSSRDGLVLRFSCTALPDGGRMLSYTPVTDLVRHRRRSGRRRLLPFAARRRRPRASLRHLRARIRARHRVACRTRLIIPSRCLNKASSPSARGLRCRARHRTRIRKCPSEPTVRFVTRQDYDAMASAVGRLQRLLPTSGATALAPESLR